MTIGEMIQKIQEHTENDGSLIIDYNSHKRSYELVLDLDIKPEQFFSELDYKTCINLNILWEVTWYNLTPIGSFHTFGSTLQIALEQMIEVIELRNKND